MAVFYEKTDSQKYNACQAEVIALLRSFSSKWKTYQNYEKLGSELACMQKQMGKKTPNLLGNFIYVNRFFIEWNWIFDEEKCDDCRTLLTRDGHKIYTRKCKNGVVQESTLYIVENESIIEKPVSLETAGATLRSRAESSIVDAPKIFTLKEVQYDHKRY